MHVLRLRKFSPIDRDYPIYEVVDNDDRVLFDVGRADDGSYELAFHAAASGQVVPLELIEAMISEARALLSEAEPS